MLKAVTETDLPLLRAWRNHPDVRRASFTTHEIGEAEHARWWAAVSENQASHVLLFEYRGRPAGVVTFHDHDVRARTAIWGFYLDVDGLGVEILAAWAALEREAIAYAFDVLDLSELFGEVLVSNVAVRAMHHRFGFVESPPYEVVVDGERREAVGILLRRRDEAKL